MFIYRLVKGSIMQYSNVMIVSSSMTDASLQDA